eukprot:9249707-Heterocapsa_arctica.AAC.1
MVVTFCQNRTSTVMKRLQINKTKWKVRMIHNREITKQTKTNDLHLEDTQKHSLLVTVNKRKAAANANIQIAQKAKKQVTSGRLHPENLTENHGQMLRA